MNTTCGAVGFNRGGPDGEPSVNFDEYSKFAPGWVLLMIASIHSSFIGINWIASSLRSSQ